MWKIRFLGKIKFLRLFIKYLFSLLFYNGRVISIKFGPLANYKWFCDNSHQFWMPLGLYEKETTQWLINVINDGDIFFDIGANAGYFSLIGSKYCGGGQVIAFEPILSNCNVINQHLNENNINNVIVENLAISKNTEKVQFSIQHNNANSHIENISITHALENKKESIQISAISLDDYIEKYKIIPSVIKVDVEGAENLVLEGATKLLQNFNTTWVISTHSSELFDECKDIMECYGYAVETLEGFHHELICKKY